MTVKPTEFNLQVLRILDLWYVFNKQEYDDRRVREFIEWLDKGLGKKK